MKLPSVMVAVDANVILSSEANGQCFYNANITLPLVSLGDADLEALEVDVVEAILKQAPADYPLDTLCKVSLCYVVPGDIPRERFAAWDKVLGFLTRNRAKYYFQPNQRDAYEQNIVDRTGVAANTANF